MLFFIFNIFFATTHNHPNKQLHNTVLYSLRQQQQQQQQQTSSTVSWQALLYWATYSTVPHTVLPLTLPVKKFVIDILLFLVVTYVFTRLF